MVYANWIAAPLCDRWLPWHGVLVRCFIADNHEVGAMVTKTHDGWTLNCYGMPFVWPDVNVDADEAECVAEQLLADEAGLP